MYRQYNIQQLYGLPTLYLCFVFIWEQTATCATYSINWLVFITEMKSIYSAVRTGALNRAVLASYLKGYLPIVLRINYIQFISISKPLYMFLVVSTPTTRSSSHSTHSISWCERDRTGTAVQSRLRRVAVTVLLTSDAVNTATWTPDEGWRHHQKHV